MSASRLSDYLEHMRQAGADACGFAGFEGEKPPGPLEPGHAHLYNVDYIDGVRPMLTFKITTVGASAGFILTKEAMARLKVRKGDTVYLTEAPDGGYRLTPYDPSFERQMALAEEIMHDDRDVLRALAK
jgi:putative addiction module antidote